jgi:Holliday junction resolvase RusA-like endonuclease
MEGSLLMLTKETMIEFFVHGDPVPQGRPRFRRVKPKSGAEFVQTYDPARSREWKEHIQKHVKKLSPTPFEKGVPLALHLIFYLKRPLSHFGTGKNAGILKASAPRFPVGVPDLDNLEKAVKDALKGITWHDDGQVVIVRKTKEYTTSQPGVWAGIREVKK